MKSVTRKKYTALICLLFFFMFFTSTGFAAYEVTPSSDIVASATPQKAPTSDVIVSWNDPADSNATIVGYSTLWNTSSTSLSSSDFNGDTSTVTTGPDVRSSTLSTSVFQGDDWDTLRYLHIQTRYFLKSASTTLLFSDDVVVVFNFDNVVTGTFSLPDPNDPTADLVSTRDTTITVTIGAPSDLATEGIYLSETGTRPATGDNTTITTYSLDDPSAGSKTITAWFEDTAGNISTPISASFELLPSVSVDPATATIDLAVTSDKIFTMAGTSGGYTWSITQEKDETGASATGTIATITTDQTTPPNSVTVSGLAKGTFVLSATNDGGTTTIESGTITVTKSTTTVDIPLITGWNLISIPVQPSDTTIATILAGISGKYSIVWGEFDPTTSGWKSYNPSKSRNSLANIEPNKGYWINMTGDATLSVSGLTATVNVSLVPGWNLIGFSGVTAADIATTLNTISGKYSIVWGEFTPSTSGWKSYNPSKSRNSISNMSSGTGYWINMTEAATLTY